MPELLERISKGELQPEQIIGHTMPLADAARGYEIFEKKQEDCRKIVPTPRAPHDPKREKGADRRPFAVT